MCCGGSRHKFIGYVHLRSVDIELAVRANNPIEREKDGFIYESAVSQPLRNVLRNGAVALAQQFAFGHTKAAQVNVKSPAMPQSRRNKAPAAARANPGNMTMHIDDVSGWGLGWRALRAREQRSGNEIQQRNTEDQFPLAE